MSVFIRVDTFHPTIARENRESEADLLHFVENQKDFSNWVKSKILEEVSKSHG
jgi:hypothetical protein